MTERSFGSLGDALASKARDVDILKEDVAIFKHLINERKHPLDLVRELVSNAGAMQVGATKIEITYTVDKSGHIFEISDDGCGMDFTGNQLTPGRLDRFLGLGLSAVVGREADEFSWKGLGSKLCFQSRRVEIETRKEGHPLYQVVVNEPWDTLNHNRLPKPKVSEFQEAGEFRGTRIKVYGHPPHRREQPFTFEEISTFLSHRTFVGYTRQRANPPEVILSVLGETQPLEFGLPEFREKDFVSGVSLDREMQTLWVNLEPKSSKEMRIRLKGFLTWDARQYRLGSDRLNVGLILSAKGIPYFELDLEKYGARGISHANPGRQNTCLVVECDAIDAEMNISRSDLVDSAASMRFREVVQDLVQTVESSAEYLAFRGIPRQKKTEGSGEALATEKRVIESVEQRWVVLERPGVPPKVLLREPRNESDVMAILWKLEALDALPFARFQTLAYPGASGGPDLLAHFQEEKSSEPMRATVVEVENNFYGYKAHKHYSGQYPKVICWDIPTSGRKIKLNSTQKKYKFTVSMDEYQVHVFVLKLIDGLRVMTRRELEERGIQV